MGAIFVEEPGKGVLISEIIVPCWKFSGIDLLLLLLCSFFLLIVIRAMAKHLGDALMLAGSNMESGERPDERTHSATRQNRKTDEENF
jgi:hypothetical protein